MSKYVGEHYYICIKSIFDPLLFFYLEEGEMVKGKIYLLSDGCAELFINYIMLLSEWREKQIDKILNS